MHVTVRKGSPVYVARGHINLMHGRGLHPYATLPKSPITALWWCAVQCQHRHGINWLDSLARYALSTE